MAQSRSFTEYVENALDNQLWEALEQHFERVSPAALGLHPRKINKIGEVELDNTKIKFVNVSDLPGTTVAFDVVLEASIIVHDADCHHNDNSDYACQWFVLKCHGDLACGLQDMAISPSIEIYDKRSRPAHPMSDSLVPIISNEQLDKEATNFLKKYCPQALRQPMWVDPAALAESMGLNVIRHRITEDCSVFGQIFFKDTYAAVYDEHNGKDIQIPVKRGTVIVDPDVFFQRNLGAYNNTIVHECVHWALHKKAFELERLFNEHASLIKCKMVGGIAEGGDEATRWMEWQANALAPRIQMPLEMFKKKAAEFIRQYSDQLKTLELCELMPVVIDELAIFFAVSRMAAKIRMVDAGYEEAVGAFIYVDKHYVKPHAFKKGALKPHQTYSIPAKDAAIQTLVNPKLRAAGKYIYIDSHFVLNHPKFVYQDENGETLMTDYARYHVDECCLAFDMSIRTQMDNFYHRECFLNRDQGALVDFDIVYTGENGELDDQKRNQLIRDMVMEEARVLDGLPNNYTKAWRALLEWRGISQAELARRTGITEKTIGHIINQETVGNVNHVVKMCLAAHLPWEMSEYLIQRSGHRLLYNNDDHAWYAFCLRTMYTKSMKEIQAFLREQGATEL